jgi:hypothetical protein
MSPDDSPAEVHKIKDHSNAVTALAMSHSEAKLFSGCKSVKVWDLTSPGLEMVACLRKHMSSVKQIVVNEKEGAVYSAGCSIKASTYHVCIATAVSMLRQRVCSYSCSCPYSNLPCFSLSSCFVLLRSF